MADPPPQSTDTPAAVIGAGADEVSTEPDSGHAKPQIEGTVQSTHHPLQQHTFTVTDMHLRTFERHDDVRPTRYSGMGYGVVIPSLFVLITQHHLKFIVAVVLWAGVLGGVALGWYWWRESKEKRTATQEVIDGIRRNAGIAEPKTVTIAPEPCPSRVRAACRSVWRWKVWYEVEGQQIAGASSPSVAPPAPPPSQL